MKLITAIPFLIVLLFCQISFANTEIKQVSLPGIRMEVRHHPEAGWAGVDYYVCLDKNCPENICDPKMACIVDGVATKFPVGDLSEEECLFVANEYMDDMERFCQDFFKDNLKTSCEGEIPKASTASQ